MKPVVSIITPTFNLEKYIGDCINSVINQTYTKWEMIILDDGSIDNTALIVKSYAKKEPRIRFIQHKKNWGVEKLRDTYNQALKVSRGTYIAILEGDDYWPTDKLAQQVNSFRKKNIVLSYGDSIFTDEIGNAFDLLYYRQKISLLNNRPTGSILELFKDFNFYFSPVTVVIKKSALMKIGGFQNARNYYFVDFPTWLCLALEGEFIYQKSVLGFYRRHKESFWLNFARQSNSMTRMEMQSAFVEFMTKNQKLLHLKHVSLNLQKCIDEQNKYILKKHENREFSFLLHSLAFGDSDEIITNIKSIFTQRNIHKKIRFVALMAMFLIPIRKQIFFLRFERKYIFYKFIRWFDALITNHFIYL